MLSLVQHFYYYRKKMCFCKLQLFSQNTDVLFFPDNFCLYQTKELQTNITTCKYQKKNVMCSKVTIKILGRSQLRSSSVFIVNCGQISHLVLFFSAADAAKCTLQMVIFTTFQLRKLYLFARATETAIDPYQYRWYWWWQ